MYQFIVSAACISILNLLTSYQCNERDIQADLRVGKFVVSFVAV